jgi:hypothetical protein
MKTRTRYSLIILGIFVFLILAPMLVLYVSGTKFNLTDRETKATGILDAKSNPGGAKLFINGKEESTTPAISRFLTQGEYEIKLQKDGYYDWVKVLPIESGKVTYTQVGVDEVQLIKKSAPKEIVPSGVKSFVLINDVIWYITENSIDKIGLTDSQKQLSLPLNFSPTSIERLRNKSHFLVSDGKNFLIVNSQNNKVTLLPTKFGSVIDIEPISDELVLFRSKNTLYEFSPKTQTAQVVRTDLTAFTFLNNTGYFASTDGNISSASWSINSFIDEQNFISGISPSDFAQKLIISDKKVLFYQNKTGLYRVGQVLETVLAQETEIELDLTTDEISIRTPSELWFYNFLTNKPQLLTRHTSKVNSFMIHSAIGYGFLATTSGLEAIEIDNRDAQNRYSLIPQGDGIQKTVWKQAMTYDQKTIIALQDGKLISVEIRN